MKEMHEHTGVMAVSEVVGSIFFPADELLGMEQLTVSAGSNFVNYGEIQV